MPKPPRVLLVSPVSAPTFWSFDRPRRLLKKKATLPPLGLATLAALLPPEWPARLVELADVPLAAIDWDAFDIVMVTAIATQSASALAAIRAARAHGKVVVVGGPLFHFFPHEALAAGADIVVRGEAETAREALIEALGGDARAIVLDAAAPADLRRSPPPRVDLLDLDLYSDMAVQFSRGCPNACEFCDVTLLFGRRVRTKTPAQVLAELEALYVRGWRRFVFFVDDNFVGRPDLTKALLRELVPWMRARGHPFDFNTQASLSLALDGELLDLMAEAGFYSVFVGIESADAGSLRRMNKAHNLALDIDDACERINRAGLQVMAGLVIGCDGEAPGADARLLDLVRRNHIPDAIVTALQAIPGTPLWERLEREGRQPRVELSDDLGGQAATVNFVPTRPHAAIAAETARLYLELYDPHAYLERVFAQLARLGPPRVRRRLILPRIWEIRATTVTILRHVLLYPSRWRFLALLARAIRRFPRRLGFLVVYLIRGEHYMAYARATARDLGERARAASASASVAAPASPEPEITGPARVTAP